MLDSAEISLIQYDIDWVWEVQREAQHFAMLHLDPVSLLLARNSFCGTEAWLVSFLFLCPLGCSLVHHPLTLHCRDAFL